MKDRFRVRMLLGFHECPRNMYYKFIVSVVFQSIVKCTKVHLYWCMRNCDGTAEDLHA